MLHADDATVENPTLKLPPDLLNAVGRHASAHKTDYRLEGWKPSLFGRLFDKLLGRSTTRH